MNVITNTLNSQQRLMPPICHMARRCYDYFDFLHAPRRLLLMPWMPYAHTRHAARLTWNKIMRLILCRYADATVSLMLILRAMPMALHCSRH